MKFDFGSAPKQYASITYKINWAMDNFVTKNNNVENLNDFRDARNVINKIKQKIKNAK